MYEKCTRDGKCPDKLDNDCIIKSYAQFHLNEHITTSITQFFQPRLVNL